MKTILDRRIAGRAARGFGVLALGALLAGPARAEGETELRAGYSGCGSGAAAIPPSFKIIRTGRWANNQIFILILGWPRPVMGRTSRPRPVRHRISTPTVHPQLTKRCESPSDVHRPSPARRVPP